jgi:hypothetical protein
MLFVYYVSLFGVAATRLRFDAICILVRALHIAGSDLVINEQLMIRVQDIDVFLSHFCLNIILISFSDIFEDSLAL